MDLINQVERIRRVRMDQNRLEEGKPVVKGDSLGTTVIRITDPIMLAASLLTAEGRSAVDIDFVATDYTTTTE